ncbi:methyltransferase domain-containing protein [Defluviimonas sp. D31]|uniref:class I SAM-dependent methyltransferase n=1 Tax=Defluviimonas sp. D31 TaxID=3083253 RepID=UPI00296F3AFC|nr:methyltransferase domain-containing protein [Defluviimonas sp. D31]MDW4549614.1 methyltransferase domain-containing protein [Defluviimonas sp. D31]
MQTAAKFWDGIAEKYAKSPIRDMESYTYTLERTRSYLSPDDRVLELGCGTGSTALLLAPRVGEITASDVSPAMIAVGRRKAAAEGVTNIRFTAADVLDEAPGEGLYDAVLAFNLLHLLPDPERALRRVAARLKPGGLFISKTICLPEPGSGWTRERLVLTLMRGALPVMQLLGKAPFVRITRIAELEAMVTAAGFKIIETGNHPAQPPRRYIVARKVAG